MVYTVTFNPSIDYIVETNDFKLGITNRTTNEYMTAGGKGINVSEVLKNLCVENEALGFVSGFTGEEILKILNEKGISNDFIKTNSGNSRINIKILHVDGTEINGIGPNITEEELGKLFKKLTKLKQDDILVLSGSVQKSIGNKIYSDILKKFPIAKVIVDATGELLLNTLEYKPFLIKPNIQELEEIFNVQIKDIDDIIFYAKKLKNKGAKNVLISMGENGALLLDEFNIIHKQKAPKGKLINSVGSGDSMISGFIKGYLETANYEYAFKMAVSAGSASAFSRNLASKDEIITIFNQML